MRLFTTYLFFLIGTLVISSCQKTPISNNWEDLFHPNSNNNTNTYKGPEVQVGKGQARTFVTLNGKAVPQEVGVMLTNEALSGLPDENTIYVLDFHQKAKETTLFEHVALGLSAHGHSLTPSGSIGPHFDTRFYMMPLAERLAIPAPPSTNYADLANTGFAAPPQGYLPEHYAYNLAVGKLGSHWDANIFTADMTVNHTMIYGTWNGAVTFINPIVTLATVASGKDYHVDFPQPQLFAKHGYYATKYNIYQDEKGRHIISLSDFVWR